MVLRESRITLGVASPEDTQPLLRLYQDFYPRLGWDEHYFRWQYVDNPAGRAISCIARLGDEVIGGYAAVPFKISIRGSLGLGWRIQDVLTRPAFSGGGIFFRLSRLTHGLLMNSSGVLNFAFPNERSHNGFIKNGWKAAFRIPLRIKELKNIELQPAACNVSPMDSFNRDIDGIWSEYAKRVDFALHRSSEFLNWRYFANPRGKYSAFKFSLRGDELILIMKYYGREDGETWGHICEFFQSGNNDELTECALREAFRFSRAHGCKALSCWCPSGNPMERPLDRFGFVLQRGLSRWFVIDPSRKGFTDPELLQENRWHLAMGDSDVF